MSRFSQSEHIEAKIRIHGHEVPFLGVRVDFGVNMPSTAVVQLIPTKYAKRIRPGTVIQVFYKCHYSSLITGREIFRLLFEGEMTGRTYQRVEGQKNISLQCVDFMNYWVHAKQYYLNFKQGQFLQAADMALFSGVGRIQGELLGAQGRIHTFFNSKTDEKGFEEVVINILKDLEGVNKYFSYNLDRTGILDKVVSASTQKMAGAIFKHKLFQRFVKQQLNKLGGTTSVWSLITMLLNLVHHELVSTPTPSFIPGQEPKSGVSNIDSMWTAKKIKEYTTGWKKNKSLFQQKKGGKSAANPQTASVLVKPNAWNIEPPACNMFFPNEVQSLSFVANYQNRMTRFQLIPTSPLFKNADLTSLTAVYKPSSLHQYIRNQYGKKINKTDLADAFGQKIKNRNRLREFDFLTNEELEIGIHPGYSTILPGAASMLMSHASSVKKAKNSTSSSSPVGSDTKVVFTNDVFEFVHNLAEFEFQRKRAAANQFSLNNTFKPMVMAGHPAVYIDDSSTDMNVTSYLVRGSHTIYANGHASTECQFALARDLDEKVPDLDEQVGSLAAKFTEIPVEAPVPDWFDEKYHYGRIGTEVYANTIGCAGLLNQGLKKANPITFANPSVVQKKLSRGQIVENETVTKLHLTEVRTKTREAINNLRGDYIGSLLNGQHGMYVFLKTFRPVVTEEQLYEQIYKGKLVGAKSYLSDNSYVGDIRFSRVEAKLFGNDPKKKKSNKDASGTNRQTDSDTSSTKRKVTFDNLEIAYPLPGRQVSIDFGITAYPSDVVNNRSVLRYRNHKGLDIPAPLGTNILSIEKGVVVFARINRGRIGYGSRIDIKHVKDGITFYSVYGHCDSIDVKVNDEVKRGQVIGKVGKTGNAMGPHLHFEIRLSVNDRADADDPTKHFTDAPSPLYRRGAILRKSGVTVSRGIHRGLLTPGAKVKIVKRFDSIHPEYPPTVKFSPSTLVSVKTGRSFLAMAIQISFTKDNKPAKYNWDKSGPAEIGFDCSGLVYATARKYGHTLPRHSLDMFQRGMIQISVEEALKTPGAILFDFREETVKGGKKKMVKHVGISFGDERRTFEALNKDNPVQAFYRGSSLKWTHAGLIPGFQYGNRRVDANEIYNKSPFAKTFADIERRLESIQINRLDIVKSYQAELASFMAFEG